MSSKFVVILLLILVILVTLVIIYQNNKEPFVNNMKIDKIYVINLKKNTDRLEKFMENAKKANVTVERFDAIYGKELQKDHPDIVKYFVKDHKLIPGEIGCALSHIKIWQDTIDNNYNNILVFEDDAIIPENFWNKFNKAYEELPKDYDMLLIGCCTCTGNTINKTKLIKANSIGNWCTAGYLININYCKKIMERIIKNEINESIDNFLRKNYHKDNIYIALPPFIIQDKTMESDITMGDLGNTLQIDKNKPVTWGT